MKRLVITLFVVLFITGCTTTDHVPAQRSVIAFDFSKYTQQGFMITPQGYDGPYESIGMINMTISPEARKSDHDLSNVRPRDDQIFRGQWIIERLTTEDVVDAAYEQAKAMGADAIINFTVTGSSRSPSIGLTIPEYTVSGFAINRLEE